MLLSQCGHHVPLQLISAGKHATTLGHLLQCGMQYDIVLGMFALTDKVLEHLSVVSQNTVLVSSGEYVESGADPGFWERGGLKYIFTTGGGGVPLP